MHEHVLTPLEMTLLNSCQAMVLLSNELVEMFEAHEAFFLLLEILFFGFVPLIELKISANIL